MKKIIPNFKEVHVCDGCDFVYNNSHSLPYKRDGKEYCIGCMRSIFNMEYCDMCRKIVPKEDLKTVPTGKRYDFGDYDLTIEEYKACGCSKCRAELKKTLQEMVDSI